MCNPAANCDGRNSGVEIEVLPLESRRLAKSNSGCKEERDERLPESRFHSVEKHPRLSTCEVLRHWSEVSVMPNHWNLRYISPLFGAAERHSQHAQDIVRPFHAHPVPYPVRDMPVDEISRHRIEAKRSECRKKPGLKNAPLLPLRRSAIRDCDVLLHPRFREFRIRRAGMKRQTGILELRASQGFLCTELFLKCPLQTLDLRLAANPPTINAEVDAPDVLAISSLIYRHSASNVAENTPIRQVHHRAYTLSQRTRMYRSAHIWLN